jgi:acyl-CoA synthetase (AMP-forming)/AMP-acid ligase II
MLHTSGTTSRPKLVPLTQRNLVTSARSIRSTLRLTTEDRGLCVMPLFHIHGIMAGLLAPLEAGGLVFCSPGFNALKFFSWMSEARPSWYTAVPTMHQMILARSSAHRDVIAANPLRFVRSSSSSMPPQVIEAIETTFSAPLVEAYGMTEASHQMASNPLPPGNRIRGTVGVAAGPEVAIMDDRGNLLTAGQTGEIVIRGESVMKEYENNPKANAEAFTSGWFRTGDQGVMDPDGYVSITGRLKEIINRGGEKISPREVDEVLMDHPAIQQVVTFAVPHAKLGEDLAAAVVLREGMSLTEKEVRDFAARRLADFKVPRKVIFLTEIPKGPTGKLQRIGLAAKLGLA